MLMKMMKHQALTMKKKVRRLWLALDIILHIRGVAGIEVKAYLPP
jgi:hypothetical protein